MLNIESMYDNIVLITDDNYTADRWNIIKNLFDTLDMTVLDFEMRISEKSNILESYVDIQPKNINKDLLLAALEQFNEFEQESDEQLELQIKMLALIRK